MKRIVFACLDEMLHFDSKEEYAAFIERLDRNNRIYKIDNVKEQKDHSVNIRIKRQYGNASFDAFIK